MLQANGLTKTYGTTRALIQLDLTVGASEIVCLLGANGAGKTTTLNLFLGFVRPTAGAALVDGKNVEDAPIATKQALAYIPEQVALYPTLTGLENLEYFAALSGRTYPTKAPLYEILAQVGIPAEVADQRTATYSKGMRQKVGIAAALAKEATSFLLDEPMSGLDPKAASEFVGALRALKERGAAVLMATHDVFRSKEVATRIGIMRSGQLVDEIDAATVAATELQAIYLRHMHADLEAAEYAL